jgi:hypothetical protein
MVLVRVFTAMNLSEENNWVDLSNTPRAKSGAIVLE